MKRILFLAILLVAGTAMAHNQTSQSKVLEKVGFVQKLDQLLPLDLTFKNEAGQAVKLRDYFGQKPVLLNFVYFECPMLCTEVLNGLVRTLRGMSLSAGKDFNVVTVSIDPKEGPTLATAKKRLYLDRYKRKGAEKGWVFLTGDDPSIHKLTGAAGFNYTYDPEIAQFAHASGILIVTPTGHISRYYFGVEYPVRDVRLSLVEASSNRIGSPVDRFLLYCYRYDPESGRYGVLIMRVLRIASLCMAASLAVMIFVLIRRERKSA